VADSETPPDGVPVGWFGKAWIVGVFAFSVARALIAWPTLSQYGVNPWVFLLIDIATAFPYALGQVKVVNGFRYRQYRGVQAWSLVVAVTFLAPYGYIVLAGQERIPALVYVVIAVLAVIFGTASVLRMRSQYRATVLASESGQVDRELVAGDFLGTEHPE
jgi:hypothetical protein